MSRRHLVDVAIATFNQKEYISEAIESCIAQKTDFDFRILIGDDCSTDGTSDIVRDYARKYPDIVIPKIRAQNTFTTPGVKRNGLTLLGECEAPYVAMLDGDDYWDHPDKLQQQVDLMEQNSGWSMCTHRTRVLFSDADAPDESGKFNRPNTNYVGKTLNAEEVAKMISIAGPSVHTSSFLYRRELLQFTPQLEELSVGDYVILMLLADQGPIHIIDQNMSIYRENLRSVSHTFRKDAFKKHMNIITFWSTINTVFQQRFDKFFKPKVVMGYKGLMSHYASEGEYLKAVQCYFKLLGFGTENWKSIRLLKSRT